MNETDVKAEEKNARRGQIGNALGIVLLIISMVVVVFIGYILLAQLLSVSETSLDNNTRAYSAIFQGFDMLDIAIAIIVVLVVILLFGLAFSSFLTGFTGGGRRGRR